MLVKSGSQKDLCPKGHCLAVRNQQVVGSNPTGGSRESNKCKVFEVHLGGHSVDLSRIVRELSELSSSRLSLIPDENSWIADWRMRFFRVGRQDGTKRYRLCAGCCDSIWSEHAGRKATAALSVTLDAVDFLVFGGRRLRYRITAFSPLNRAKRKSRVEIFRRSAASFSSAECSGWRRDPKSRRTTRAIPRAGMKSENIWHTSLRCSPRMTSTRLC